MFVFIFFFKQKTAYEMRISDWSSDVCSSDLPPAAAAAPGSARESVQGLRPAGPPAPAQRPGPHGPGRDAQRLGPPLGVLRDDRSGWRPNGPLKMRSCLVAPASG